MYQKAIGLLPRRELFMTCDLCKREFEPNQVEPPPASLCPCCAEMIQRLLVLEASREATEAQASLRRPSVSAAAASKA
jgi:hypothetical protein